MLFQVSNITSFFFPSAGAMAGTLPRKRGRPRGTRQYKPPPIPDFIIPTAFSRSGRPIKMKELPDGTHFGIMNLPLELKQEPKFESPSSPPAKKPRLEKKVKTTPVMHYSSPEKKVEEDPVEDKSPSVEEETEKSSGDIFFLRTTMEKHPGKKLHRKKAIPKKPICDGNSVIIKTRTKGLDDLEIQINRTERKISLKDIKVEADKLKSKIENGEPLPPLVQKCIDEVLQQKRKMIEIEREEKFAHKDMIAKELDYIFQMAECDLLIKGSLSKREWDHEKCLCALRKLWTIPVTRQMLFKFPRALETAKYVYTRIEEIEAFSDPDKAPDRNAIIKHHICEAAKKVFESYKSVFTYSEDSNFWDYFKAELEHYQADASKMSTYDYYNSDGLPYLTRCFTP